MAPAGNLIFVVMIMIVHTVKSTVIMNLNETKIVKKSDEVDLKHHYKPKFINSPNVFYGMNLNEYNVIKIQVQAYPRPEIIQMNVGNVVIKPKIVDGSKAMKSSPLLRPFCGSEFCGFFQLKI